MDMEEEKKERKKLFNKLQTRRHEDNQQASCTDNVAGNGVEIVDNFLIVSFMNF